MDHPAIGEKYFDLSGWKSLILVFKEELLENFELIGAAKLNAEETEEETEDEFGENDLTGFTYGDIRGFLFAPDEVIRFWTRILPILVDAKHNAWFFRRQHLDNFLNMGVTHA